MKKTLTLAIVMLTLLLTGQAFAYFEPGHLVQVVYNGTTAERGVDLGAIDTAGWDSASSNIIMSQAGSISLAGLGADSWSQLRVGYFSYNATGYKAYFATTQQTAPSISTSNRTNFANAANYVMTNYYRNVLGGATEQVVDGAPSHANSYRIRLNSNGNAPGCYGNFNASATRPYGESVLTALGSIGFVDMYLYAYDIVTLNTGSNTLTPYVAQLRLFADGHTEVVGSGSPVPVPASLLLFGSGLLGFFGLKRKEA